MTVDLDFVLRVLRIFNDIGQHDSLFWRTDGEFAPVRFFVNCNDLFYWATADSEDLTAENIGDLEKTIAEVQKATGTESWSTIPNATDLFCCRMRQMRPQRPYYRHLDNRLKPLFDACGPERDPTGEG